jgi:hypothetical protein
VRGTPAALYRLALSLHAVTPLSIETESRAERSHRLRDRNGPKRREPVPVELPDDIDAGTTLSRDRVQCDGSSLVKQGRRSRRRYGRHASGERVAGAARDWDIVCRDTAKIVGESDEVGYGGLMREAAEARRRAAGPTSAHEMEAPNFTGPVFSLSAWTVSRQQPEDALGDESLQQQLSNIAPRLLDRMADKVDKPGWASVRMLLRRNCMLFANRSKCCATWSSRPLAIREET